LLLDLFQPIRLFAYERDGLNRNCGAKLTIRKRIYCDNCFPKHVEQARRANGPKFRAAGDAKLAEMRARGLDPTNRPEVQRQRAASASAQRRAGLAWRDDGSLNGVDFKRDILPGLQDVPVRAIAEAMGSTHSHASKVRCGRLAPHKRHWGALATLSRDKR
jgi:hypothetical protein